MILIKIPSQSEINIGEIERRPGRSYIPYVAPFALLAMFTCIGLFYHVSRLLTYPIKTVLVASSLLYFWDAYKQEIRFSFSWLAIISGMVVFLIWVLTEGLYPQIGHCEFNPYEQASGYAVYLVIAFRLIGASLVVPLAEELFWRSFALRFSIRSDFKSVPLGQFSWFSFIFISFLFGFEHQRWLVGIIAGMVYAGVLYRSKNLFVPILSHATTNFLLGLFVLSSHQWSFW
ncbi:MAG TPA: CAAX prenyl protease-related protein [Desulfatiglandales bacterium]|nr:CAAX prenyl protease-related protein [Desulfatiglandales bacterium]